MTELCPNCNYDITATLDALTRERGAAGGRARAEALGSEALSEIARKANRAKGAKARREAALKAWATKRDKAAQA